MKVRRPPSPRPSPTACNGPSARSARPCRDSSRSRSTHRVSWRPSSSWRRRRTRCGIDCRVEGDERVRIDDNVVATHLFRIVQEAINNAVEHRSPRQILVHPKCPTERSASPSRSTASASARAPGRTTADGIENHAVPSGRHRRHAGSSPPRRPRDGRGSVRSTTRLPPPTRTRPETMKRTATEAHGDSDPDRSTTTRSSAAACDC